MLRWRAACAATPVPPQRARDVRRASLARAALSRSRVSKNPGVAVTAHPSGSAVRGPGPGTPSQTIVADDRKPPPATHFDTGRRARILAVVVVGPVIRRAAA